MLLHRQAEQIPCAPWSVHTCTFARDSKRAAKREQRALSFLLCFLKRTCHHLPVSFFCFGFAQEARLCFGGAAIGRAGIFAPCRVQRHLTLIWFEHPSSDQARLLLRPPSPPPPHLTLFLVLCCCQQNPNTAVNIVRRIHISCGVEYEQLCIVQFLLPQHACRAAANRGVVVECSTTSIYQTNWCNFSNFIKKGKQV